MAENVSIDDLDFHTLTRVRGFTLDTLAEAADVSEGTVAKCSRPLPGADVAKRLSKALRISKRQLFEAIARSAQKQLEQLEAVA